MPDHCTRWVRSCHGRNMLRILRVLMGFFGMPCDVGGRHLPEGMPETYPPYASGTAYILTTDLVQHLASTPHVITAQQKRVSKWRHSR